MLKHKGGGSEASSSGRNRVCVEGHSRLQGMDWPGHPDRRERKPALALGERTPTCHLESLGANLIRVLSTELLENLENGGLKRFKDIEQEGGPIQNPDDMEMDHPPHFLKTTLFESQG